MLLTSDLFLATDQNFLASRVSWGILVNLLESVLLELTLLLYTGRLHHLLLTVNTTMASAHSLRLRVVKLGLRLYHLLLLVHVLLLRCSLD
jgi:hypothetical protein